MPHAILSVNFSRPGKKTTDPEIRKKSATQTDSGLDRHDTETLNSFYSGSPRRFPGWQSRRNAAAGTAYRIRSAPTWLCKCGCSQRLPPSSRHRPGDQSAYSNAGGRAIQSFALPTELWHHPRKTGYSLLSWCKDKQKI